MAVISLLFCVDDHLPQADVVGGGPGADHVDGRLGVGLVEALPQGLAVDGDELPGGDLVQRGDPAEQAPLELGGLDAP